MERSVIFKAQNPQSKHVFAERGILSWICLGVSIAILAAAYSNALSTPWVLDDEATLLTNKSIRSLFRLGEVLSPPEGTTVEGRPVANLSFAINYAISGTETWSYHVGNGMIHACAALLLFGVVGRTLRRDSRFTDSAEWIAVIAAALWALHPLQTESVTYTVQRVESLMGFFYLLTIYAFIRSVESGRSTVWKTVAVTACWLGMGAKEVMVSAPVLVWLYDRTFVAGTFSAAWRQRWHFYAALFASWLLLGWLLSSSIDRNNTAGFGTEVSPWHYLLTQCRAIGIYLKLSFWPDDQVFDYGRMLVTDPRAVMLQGALLISLLLLTVWAVVRRSWLGVAGAWFFATLAPSSSIVPVVTQTMAEHRMYLALAAVVVVTVMAIHRLAGARGLIGLGLCVPVLAVATYRRNAVYQDTVALWQDTVEKVPGSTRAQTNLGSHLTHRGRIEEALVHLEAALHGDYLDAHVCTNYAFTLFLADKLDESGAMLDRALKINPRFQKAIALKGTIAMKRGQSREAVVFFENALRLKPNDFTSRVNLARALQHVGDVENSRKEYLQVTMDEEAATDGSSRHAWLGLGDQAFAARQWPEAARCFQRAIDVSKSEEAAPAYSNLADTYFMMERFSEAQTHYVRALEIDPEFAKARTGLAFMLARSGRLPEAAAEYERAARKSPDDASLFGNLGMVYEMMGRLPKAIECYERAVSLDTAHAFARSKLEQLRSR
jgi:protein O-mannosyl-transferase